VYVHDLLFHFIYLSIALIVFRLIRWSTDTLDSRLIHRCMELGSRNEDELWAHDNCMNENQENKTVQIERKLSQSLIAFCQMLYTLGWVLLVLPVVWTIKLWSTSLIQCKWYPLANGQTKSVLTRNIARAQIDTHASGHHAKGIESHCMHLEITRLPKVSPFSCLLKGREKESKLTNLTKVYVNISASRQTHDVNTTDTHHISSSQTKASLRSSGFRWLLTNTYHTV